MTPRSGPYGWDASARIETTRRSPHVPDGTRRAGAAAAGTHLDAIGIEPQAVCVDDAVRDTQPHHKAARRALVAVDEPDPLEARVHVRLLNVLPVEGARADRGGKLVDRVEGRRRVLRQLCLLDRIAVRSAVDGILRQEGRPRRPFPCRPRWPNRKLCANRRFGYRHGRACGAVAGVVWESKSEGACGARSHHGAIDDCAVADRVQRDECGGTALHARTRGRQEGIHTQVQAASGVASGEVAQVSLSAHCGLSCEKFMF